MLCNFMFNSVDNMLPVLSGKNLECFALWFSSSLYLGLCTTLCPMACQINPSLLKCGKSC